MAKGGSKVLTAVIAFILGFIFAILAEIGAIVGVYLYVSTADLDSIFNAIGIDNIDSDGNYVYINTDSSDGGAHNVGELLTALQGYLYSEGSYTMDYPVLGKSLEEISNLLPIVHRTLSEKLYPVVSEYMDIEWDEFESVPVSELPQFLSDSVMEIRPAKLLAKMGMNGLVGEDANILVNALLAGAEFDYAETSAGLKFPVYYDTYVFDGVLNCYNREVGENGVDAYPHNLNENLLYNTTTRNDDNKTIYRLYFIPCLLDEDTHTISDAVLSTDEEGDTIYDESTTFIAVRYDTDEDKFELDLQDLEHRLYQHDYGMHNLDRTGNFYYTNGSEELQIFPVTIRSFSDPDEVFKPLYSTGITELLGGGESNIIEKLFGKLSVGEMIDGKVDFDGIVNNLELSTVINVDPANALMSYIGYGLSNVTAVNRDDLGYDYTGYAEVDGATRLCYIASELKGNGEEKNSTIARVWYIDENGKDQPVPGTKVSQVSDLATNMEITVLLNVKASDSIMCYLGYGISEIKAQEGADYNHVGKYELTDEEGTVKEVTAYINTDEEGYVSSAWYIEDGFDVNIPGTNVNNISDRVNGIMDKIAITDFMKVESDKPIMLYIGYGVTNVRALAGEGYTHVGKYRDGDESYTCYINSDEEKKVTEAYYFGANGERITLSGATVNTVSSRVNNISENLSLPDVIPSKPTDKIMSYISYGITAITAQDGEDYSHVAKYKLDDETTADCFIATNDKGEVTTVWYMDGDETVYVEGTVISKLSARIEGLSEDLTLGDILTIKESDKILWSLRDTTIKNIGEEVKNLKVSDVLDEKDIQNSAILKQLANKSLDDLSHAIDAIAIQSIYSENIYGVEKNSDPQEVTEYKSDILYFVKEIDKDGNETFVYVETNPDLVGTEKDDNVGVLTKEQFDEGVANGITYYSYGEATGMWRLILFKNNREKVYTLNNFNNMINTSTQNIYNATLKTLQEAKIIDSNLNLDKTLPGASKKLSEMTFKELMEAVISMSN